MKPLTPASFGRWGALLTVISANVRVLLITAFLVLAGCLPSVNPLYTEQDLIFDPALIGEWSEKPGSTDRWVFSKLDEKSYKLVITEGKEESPFVARLLKLGGERFLDLQPEKGPIEAAKVGGTYKSLLVRGHLSMRLDLTESVLRVTMLDGDWLSKLLKADPAALDHSRVEDDWLVLTASTKDLQKFVLKHLETAGAWGDPTVLRRLRP